MVCELKKEGVRLVKVRNPHGTAVWQGDWCPTSPLWTPETLERLGEIDDEGEFFIPYDDYLEQFSQTTICFFNPYETLNSDFKSHTFYQENPQVPKTTHP